MESYAYIDRMSGCPETCPEIRDKLAHNTNHRFQIQPYKCLLAVTPRVVWTRSECCETVSAHTSKRMVSVGDMGIRVLGGARFQESLLLGEVPATLLCRRVRKNEQRNTCVADR